MPMAVLYSRQNRSDTMTDELIAKESGDISDIFEILRKNFNNDTYGYVDTPTLYALASEISKIIDGR